MPPCICMTGAEVCGACGTPTRRFVVDDRPLRFHFAFHEQVGPLVKHLFHPHSSEACRAARLHVLLQLRKRGALSEDQPR